MHSYLPSVALRALICLPRLRSDLFIGNVRRASSKLCQQFSSKESVKTLVEKHIRAYMNVLFNPLRPELNPICYLLALLAYDFLHVSRIRVKSLTLRLLMSYIIYMTLVT
jgi:transposase